MMTLRMITAVMAILTLLSFVIYYCLRVSALLYIPIALEKITLRKMSYFVL